MVTHGLEKSLQVVLRTTFESVNLFQFRHKWCQWIHVYECPLQSFRRIGSDVETEILKERIRNVHIHEEFQLSTINSWGGCSIRKGLRLRIWFGAAKLFSRSTIWELLSYHKHIQDSKF